ncbi:MAG: MBL fold metallo-hydrolase [Bacilli bacterium]|jgi:7,8-dihydropterin-6-yl-methyl-4-(beta-D-ribofuranosyl)aminobenzene 5'-phosphate synthase|nr:MBL fold metallo-hydrolase [Bacilli bacterium]
MSIIVLGKEILMLIKSLSDNISLNEKFLHEHGLSIYIEINNIKVLFDTGASSIFSNNALKLNIKLKDVDYLIISHGHYDHGGGLNTFLNINTKAKIFFQKMLLMIFILVRKIIQQSI